MPVWVVTMRMGTMWAVTVMPVAVAQRVVPLTRRVRGAVAVVQLLAVSGAGPAGDRVVHSALPSRAWPPATEFEDVKPAEAITSQEPQVDQDPDWLCLYILP